jgi:hypothetical protein
MEDGAAGSRPSSAGRIPVPAIDAPFPIARDRPIGGRDAEPTLSRDRPRPGGAHHETELLPVRPPDDTLGRARSNEADLAALVFWPS